MSSASVFSPFVVAGVGIEKRADNTESTSSMHRGRTKTEDDEQGHG